MTWVEALNMFVIGVVVGYFWYPLWEISKKIVREAKKAREEW